MLKSFLIEGIDQAEYMKVSTKQWMEASMLRSTASSIYIMQKMTQTGLGTKSSYVGIYTHFLKIQCFYDISCTIFLHTGKRLIKINT